jgi:alpha-tubulin suppressor-like RCC1 family protein
MPDRRCRPALFSLLAISTVACGRTGLYAETSDDSPRSGRPSQGVVPDASQGSPPVVHDAATPPIADRDQGSANGGDDANTPVVTQIATGANHACALLADETVSCWGTNSVAETGSGRQSEVGTISPLVVTHPTPVEGLRGVIQLTSGEGKFTCAVTRERDVYCWGSLNECGQLGRGDPLLGSAGTLYPRLTASTVIELGDVVQVRTGSQHACALSKTGAVYCWGRDPGALGRELGEADTAQCGAAFDGTPGLVPGLKGNRVVELGVGLGLSCAIHEGGRAMCWGGWIPPQSGLDPLEVSGLQDAVEIGGGNGYICARTIQGKVLCRGYNNFGLLGRGDDARNAFYDTVAPVALPEERRAVQLAVGTGRSCALLDNQTVWCWGDGRFGAMGTAFGDGMVAYTPVRVEGLAGPVAEIRVGDLFNCARLVDGRVQCWGRSPAVVYDGSDHPEPVTILF